jgi:hypothetical protein
VRYITEVRRIVLVSVQDEVYWVACRTRVSSHPPRFCKRLILADDASAERSTRHATAVALDLLPLQQA